MQDRAKAVPQHDPIATAEQCWRQFGAGRSLADPYSSLLPQDNAEGIDRIAEDSVPVWRSGAGHRESLQCRTAEHRPTRHAEDPGDVDERPQRALLQLKGREALAGTVDHRGF